MKGSALGTLKNVELALVVSSFLISSACRGDALVTPRPSSL